MESGSHLHRTITKTSLIIFCKEELKLPEPHSQSAAGYNSIMLDVLFMDVLGPSLV